MAPTPGRSESGASSDRTGSDRIGLDRTGSGRVGSGRVGTSDATVRTRRFGCDGDYRAVETILITSPSVSS
jgi:hypothetical protein